MKYKLIVPAFIALLGVGTHSLAAEENEVAHTYDQQWQGMGIGGLMGALVGGPPGFIVGLASGALIGHQTGQADDLANARQKVLELTEGQNKLQNDLQTAQHEVTLLRQNISQQKPSRGETNKQHADQLAAIAKGFVLNVQFRTESAELAPHFKQQLTHIMMLLDAFPELVIHVNGYADQRGTDQFNHALSQQRVNAVAQYLQAAGVAVNRIRKVSHGKSQAQYSVNDIDGMSFDRRVVLYFCRKSS